MPANGIFDTTIHFLDKVLDLRSQKLRIISANIANAETPGYARLEMNFEEALAWAAGGPGAGQAATHPQHFGFTGKPGLDGLETEVFTRPVRNPVGDGNNVILEQEMMDLAENQIRYEAGVRMLGKKINMLKLVIQEKV